MDSRTATTIPPYIKTAHSRYQPNRATANNANGSKHCRQRFPCHPGAPSLRVCFDITRRAAVDALFTDGNYLEAFCAAKVRIWIDVSTHGTSNIAMPVI